MRKVFFTLLLLLCALASSAYDFEVDGIRYNYTEDNDGNVTAEVARSTNYTGDITIPSTVTYEGTTYTVTSIGKSAFSSCYNLSSVTLPESLIKIGPLAFYLCYSLSSITLPESLIEIGESAFSGCGVSSVTLPDSLIEIGKRAFWSSSLSSIEIPASVTTIGESAFSQCRRLSAITVSADNQHYSSVDGVLYSKDVSTLLWFPSKREGEFTIPETVNYIDEEAFYECALSKVVMPSVIGIGKLAFASCYELSSVTLSQSLIEIGESAFEGCSALSSIEIPASVTKIGASAFHLCDLLPEITVSEDNQYYASIDGALYNKDVSTLFWFPKMREGEFTIPETVTCIDEHVFVCCALSKVVMPSVTEIGDSAFFQAESLKTVEFSSSLTKVGIMAFFWCDLLNNIVLPASLTNMGFGVFNGCSALTNMVSLNPEPPVVDSVFSSGSGLSRIYVPKEAVDAYRASQAWGNFEIVGIDVAGSDSAQVYVASDIEAEEVGSVQEARDEVAFNFALYDDVAAGQGVATLTCQDSNEVVDLPAAQIAGAATVRGLRVEAADGNDYQVVQPLGDAAQNCGYYTVHFPNGYFLLGTDKMASPAFELSFTVGEVSALTNIKADDSDAEPEYFTLQGVKVVGTPAPGLYICRQGKKVTKCVIR